MRPRPDQLLTLTHWLVAAGIAGAAHLAVFLPTAGNSLVDHVEPQDAGVTLDLRVAAPATPAAPPAKRPPQEARPTLPATAAHRPQRLSRPSATSATSATSAAGRRPQDDYFTILQQWLAQFRTYPDAAKHQGWEGVVELSFSIDSRGSIRGATMTRSSGVALLDNAAFELLDRASPLPPPPADDAPLRVTVPVAYRLGVP